MGRRAILIHLALIAVFGIGLPWFKGADFLDSVILSAYACLGILFAAPAASEAFAQSRPQTFADAIAKVVIAVTYAESMTVTVLGLGLITVYSEIYWRVRFVLTPDLETLGLSALFGLAASAAMAAIAGWITLQFSASAARIALRIIFLGLLALFFYRSRWLPDVAGTGALLALIIGGGAVLAMRRGFKR
jgi:hypothetical protein